MRKTSECKLKIKKGQFLFCLVNIPLFLSFFKHFIFSLNKIKITNVKLKLEKIGIT